MEQCVNKGLGKANWRAPVDVEKLKIALTLIVGNIYGITTKFCEKSTQLVPSIMIQRL